MHKKINNKPDFSQQQNNSNSRRGFLTKLVLTGSAVALNTFVGRTATNEDNSEEIAKTHPETIGSNMPYRNLGSLKVSALGFGCLPTIGFYGGPKSRKEMISIIRKAYDKGVTLFDTAESYGPLLSEEILGEAVTPFRKNIVLSTKFGFNINQETRERTREKNSRPEHIKKAVEGSLRRLKSDYIDLYYQHRVDPKIPIEDVAGAIKDLIAEGKVNHFGLSEPGINTISRAHAVLPISAIQNEYSIWARDAETTILPLCEKLGIGFVPWCPLGYGFLAGAVTDDTILGLGDVRWNLPRVGVHENLRQNLKLLDYMKIWAKRKNTTLAQISLSWLLTQKPYIVPIPGTSQFNHLNENLKSTNLKFSISEMKEFNEGLTRIKIEGARNAKAIMDDMGVEAPVKE